MLYNLFEYLNDVYDLPGAGVFQYISFSQQDYYILIVSSCWK